MRILIQISIIFIICIIGAVISDLLATVSIPIPSSVVGMILLFVLLILGIVKKNSIQDVSSFLLSHMAFFFVPAGVGLVNSFHLFADKMVQLIAVCVINTVLTFAATAFSVTLTVKIINKLKKEL